jgi:shikimate dehydrogenase
VKRVLFVGISTAGSLIHHVFPVWMEALGIGAVVEGVDLPPDVPDAGYRSLVERIAADQDVVGAVITSHKLGVHGAARALLTAGDAYVDLLGEVNAIDGALNAFATDPAAVTATLPEVLAGGPPPTEALCLGAGGAGVAVIVSLWRRRLRRLVVTDAQPERLRAVRAVLDALPATPTEVRLVAATENDRELARLAPGALVVNATGLGKDAPGSPVAARFPVRAIVWDANYRGPLPFLTNARAQGGGLRVHDGWSYFVHGWAQALSPILDRPLDAALLGQIAEPLR